MVFPSNYWIKILRVILNFSQECWWPPADFVIPPPPLLVHVVIECPLPSCSEWSYTIDLSPLWELGLTPGSSLDSAIHFSFDFTSLFLCGCLPSFYTRAQNVWSGWPVYELKCLCSRAQEWGRQGCHSQEIFNIWFLWHEVLVI